MNRKNSLVLIFIVILGIWPVAAQETDANLEWTLAPQVSFNNHASDGMSVSFIWGQDGESCIGQSADLVYMTSQNCTGEVLGLYQYGSAAIMWNSQAAWFGDARGSNAWSVEGMSDTVYAGGNFLSVIDGNVCREVFGNQIGDCYSFEFEDEEVEAVFVASQLGQFVYGFWFVDTQNRIWRYLPEAQNPLTLEAEMQFDVTVFEYVETENRIEYLFVGGQNTVWRYQVVSNDTIDFPHSAEFSGVAQSISVAPNGRTVNINFITPENELASQKFDTSIMFPSGEAVIGSFAWYLPEFLWTNPNDMLSFTLIDGGPVISLWATNLFMCRYTINGVNYAKEVRVGEECPVST